MLRDAVLVGSAEAVSEAWEARESWRPRGFRARGAVLVGPGDSELPLLVRAPIWDALDLADVKAPALILIEPPTDGATKRAVLKRAAEAGMKTFVLENGKVRRLRLDDLIGRPLEDPDWRRIKSIIAGKRVLVTGGGGSIGSELARRIATFAPERLTLLDSSEHNLYLIGRELPEAV